MEFIIISLASLLTDGTTEFRLYGVFLSLFIFHSLMILSLTFGYVIKSMIDEVKNKKVDQDAFNEKYFKLLGLNGAFLLLDFIIKNNLEEYEYNLTDFAFLLIVGYFLLIISKNLSILKK